MESNWSFGGAREQLSTKDATGVNLRSGPSSNPPGEGRSDAASACDSLAVSTPMPPPLQLSGCSTPSSSSDNAHESVVTGTRHSYGEQPAEVENSSWRGCMHVSSSSVSFWWTHNPAASWSGHRPACASTVWIPVVPGSGPKPAAGKRRKTRGPPPTLGPAVTTLNGGPGMATPTEDSFRSPPAEAIDDGGNLLPYSRR